MAETAPSILSLSPSYSTEDVYQRVPGSPISPSYARLSSRNQNCNASPVPDVFSGSPLLRQILKGGFRGKRQCPTDSPACSNATKKRRASCVSPLVPSPITHFYSAQEQVVPVLSPQAVASISEPNDYKRKLPEEKEGVKPLDLFNGDDIFAPSHEE